MIKTLLERAKRLLPDNSSYSLAILAGNSSNLPIVRTLVREVLDLTDGRIHFDPVDAKIAVAKGACFARRNELVPSVVRYELGSLLRRLPWDVGCKVEGAPFEDMFFQRGAELPTKAPYVYKPKGADVKLLRSAPGSHFQDDPEAIGYFDFGSPDGDKDAPPPPPEVKKAQAAAGPASAMKKPKDKAALPPITIWVDEDRRIGAEKNGKFYSFRAKTEEFPPSTTRSAASTDGVAFAGSPGEGIGRTSPGAGSGSRARRRAARAAPGPSPDYSSVPSRGVGGRGRFGVSRSRAAQAYAPQIRRAAEARSKPEGARASDAAAGSHESCVRARAARVAPRLREDMPIASPRPDRGPEPGGPDPERATRSLAAPSEPLSPPAALLATELVARADEAVEGLEAGTALRKALREAARLIVLRGATPAHAAAFVNALLAQRAHGTRGEAELLDEAEAAARALLQAVGATADASEGQPPEAQRREACPSDRPAGQALAVVAPSWRSARGEVLAPGLLQVSRGPASRLERAIARAGRAARRLAKKAEDAEQRFAELVAGLEALDAEGEVRRAVEALRALEALAALHGTTGRDAAASGAADLVLLLAERSMAPIPEDGGRVPLEEGGEPQPAETGHLRIVGRTTRRRPGRS